MAELGTPTVKVVPDLDEFTRIMEALPKVGLTIREETTHERDNEGVIYRTIKTTSVVKGV